MPLNCCDVPRTVEGFLTRTGQPQISGRNRPVLKSQQSRFLERLMDQLWEWFTLLNSYFFKTAETTLVFQVVITEIYFIPYLISNKNNLLIIMKFSGCKIGTGGRPGPQQHGSKLVIINSWCIDIIHVLLPVLHYTNVFFDHNSNSMEILFCSFLISNRVTTTKFYTWQAQQLYCHGTHNVWCNLIASNWFNFDGNLTLL